MPLPRPWGQCNPSWTSTSDKVKIFKQTVKIFETIITCTPYRESVRQDCVGRNALAWSLTAAEASHFRAFKTARAGCANYIPALSTMAMGDVNAVEIGQQAHVLLAAGIGIQRGDLITLRGRMPRQHFAVGIIIDDFVVVERVPRNIANAGIGADIAKLMVEEYRRVGLSPNDDKRVKDSKQPQFWGISIDGEEGILRPQVERVLPIAMLTAKVAKLGVANRKLLEVLAGSWISILAVRRRAMCLLSSIFHDIQDYDYDTIFTMRASTVSELWSVVVLAPLLCSDLRARPSDELSMVDASDTHRAEVHCLLEPGVGEELVRHKLTKASWTKLLSPLRALLRLHGKLDPALEVPEGEEPLAAHPFWTMLAQTQQFKVKQVHRIGKRTHINISELKAACEAEVRRARAHPNQRHAIGSDSQVALGSLIKGRSSAGLNGVLRRSLPSLLGYNSYGIFHYIPTAENPADDPTRHRGVRGPSKEEPEWYQDVKKGIYDSLDNYLEAEGLGEAELARLPEFPAVSAPATSELTMRALRRRSWKRQSSIRTGLKQGPQQRPPDTAAISRSPWMPKKVLSESAVKLLQAIPTHQFVWPGGKVDLELLKQPGHLELVFWKPESCNSFD